MPDFFHEAEEAVFGHHRHHDTSAAPAAATATIRTSNPGGPVSLITTLEDDVKTDLTQGVGWLKGFVGRLEQAAPGIIATTEAVGGSTVGQLAEIFLGKILPPDVEAEFLALAKRYAVTFGQPVAPAADPAPSFTPAGPTVAGQA
jgi:hypothetical protein